MADFIEDAAIPVAMVGLLSALPNTQMTRRLVSEHRLYEGHDFHATDRADQCSRPELRDAAAATGDFRRLPPGSRPNLRSRRLLWSRRTVDRQAQVEPRTPPLSPRRHAAAS